jgi:hypothetical protein
MMDAGELKIPMSEVVSKITMTIFVTGQRTFALRFWLGIKLLKFAAFVIGMPIHLTTMDE